MFIASFKIIDNAQMLQHTWRPQQAPSLLILVPSVAFCDHKNEQDGGFCRQESIHVNKVLKEGKINFFKNVDKVKTVDDKGKAREG